MRSLADNMKLQLAIIATYQPGMSMHSTPHSDKVPAINQHLHTLNTQHAIVQSVCQCNV